MAERRYRVELTASFLQSLDVVEAFLLEADAGPAFDALLADLRASVIPNLSRFPRIGRRYLDDPPQSAEALAQLAALSAGAADALRLYLHGDYLMLYIASEVDNMVYLLSIGITARFRSTSLPYGLAPDGAAKTVELLPNPSPTVVNPDPFDPRILTPGLKLLEQGFSRQCSQPG